MMIYRAYPLYNLYSIGLRSSRIDNKIHHKIEFKRLHKHIEKYTHIHMTDSPPPIEQKSPENHAYPISPTPHTLFIHLIQRQKTKEEKQDIWKDSPYKDIVKLQSNNAGIVGESFIQQICDSIQIDANIDGTKTKKIGGGTGDGTIKNKTVEIKTAHQGCTTNNFQHELGEMPWNAEYMIFIDISPICIYLTIFKNFSEEQYKSGNKCVPYFPTKSVTWRKGKGAFKLDTTVSINENNVEKGYTLKLTNTTVLSEIQHFIHLHILE